MGRMIEIKEPCRSYIINVLWCLLMALLFGAAFCFWALMNLVPST
jgi:hypothetical protein